MLSIGDVWRHNDMSWLFLRVDRVDENNMVTLTVLNPTNNPSMDWAESVEVAFNTDYIYENYKLHEKGFADPDWEV